MLNMCHDQTLIVLVRQETKFETSYNKIFWNENVLLSMSFVYINNFLQVYASPMPKQYLWQGSWNHWCRGPQTMNKGDKHPQYTSRPWKQCALITLTIPMQPEDPHRQKNTQLLWAQFVQHKHVNATSTVQNSCNPEPKKSKQQCQPWKEQKKD